MPDKVIDWPAVPRFEEEDGKADHEQESREGILFLVEASESLVSARPDGDCPIVHILRAFYSLARARAIDGPSDELGLRVFNVQAEAAEDVVPLGPVKVESLEKVASLVERLETDSEDAKRIFAPKPGSSTVAFGSELQRMNKTFESHGRLNRRAFFVTDNDQHGADKQLLERTLTIASDVSSLHIQMSWFFIDKSPKEPFDISHFYQYLVAPATGDDNGLADAADSDLVKEAQAIKDEPDQKPRKPRTELFFVERTASELAGDIARALSFFHAAKRVSMGLPFILGPGVVVDILAYNSIAPKTKAEPKRVDLASSALGQQVVTKREYLDDQTGLVVDPEELVRVITVSNGDAPPIPVVIPESAPPSARTAFLPPGIHLVGFMPRSAVKIEHIIKHSHFIYPDDRQRIGSSRVFASLLDTMLLRNMIALVAVVHKSRTSSASLAWALPQAERLSPTGMQIQPPGMFLCYIAYQDDFKEASSLTENYTKSMSIGRIFQEQQDSESPGARVLPLAELLLQRAQDVATALSRSTVDPTAFTNPGLAVHNELLAATALGEAFEKPEDTLVPDVGLIDEAAGGLIRDMERIAGEIEDGLGGRDDRDLVDEIRDALDAGHNVTIPQLKQVLELVNLPTTGTKAALAERLQAYFAKRQRTV